MSDRPELTDKLSSKEFLEYYYLKEELVRFCRENGLPASGGKQDLTRRIAFFLDTGKVQETKTAVTPKKNITEIIVSPEYTLFFPHLFGSFSIA